MYRYHKKESDTNTPFFPCIGSSKLSRMQTTALSKNTKIQKPIQSPEPQIMCCRQIVEHKIQLVPPAKQGTITVDKQILANIEKVCSEVVVIIGFIRKTITYTAVIHNEEVPNYSIQDDVPFQCLIESTAIKENNQFDITEQKILSEVFSQEVNLGQSNNPELYMHTLAFNLIEKDIIKISVQMIT
ncbi:hypothetical protein [Bacillus sp. BP-3]|uniref:hypothetical protein n=1 Tax=Bacillus sp. BP-3 TaxID=3022773 RepID=UPI00232E3A79|nr:hypothetical protein [Bacillus sp. BP-3]MDC2863102.1 hypothetical protein [Bacillus sp. BP-3]